MILKKHTQKLKKMKNKTFTITDTEAAEILFMKMKTGFARANWTIKKMKEESLPLWWDLLWDGLAHGGDYLIKSYMQRWSEKYHVNLDDMEQRNELRKKLSVLEDPHYKYGFPQRFLHRADDGSFSIDEEVLKQHCIEQCTYILTEEQKQAIDNIVSGLQTLKLHPDRVRCYFYQKEGKINTIGHEIHKHANGLRSGMQEKDHRAQKFNAIRQVLRLKENEWYL